MSSFRGRIRTLRTLARLLAGETSGASPAIDWEALLGLLDELDVAPALWSALPRGDRDRLPGVVAERLRRDYVANVARNLRLRRALTEIVEALDSAGIVPLLFKGSAWLGSQESRDLGSRWMADLDLAVRRTDWAAAVATFAGLGYTSPQERPFEHIHEVALVGDRCPAPVELHEEIGGGPLATILPASEAWRDSDQVAVGEASARTLSRTHAVLHNVVHSTVQDFGHAGGDLPLRQLIALRRLTEEPGDAIEWAAIRHRMEHHGLARELDAYLWLASRYAGMVLPRGGWVRARRGHELRVLVSFGLGWPARAHLKLRYALGDAYLDSLYEHGGRPFPLLLARLRHIVTVGRRDGGAVIDELIGRRS